MRYYKVILLLVVLAFSAEARAEDVVAEYHFPFEDVREELNEALQQAGAGEHIMVDNVYATVSGTADTFPIKQEIELYFDHDFRLAKLDFNPQARRFDALLEADVQHISGADLHATAPLDVRSAPSLPEGTLEVRGRFVEVVEIPVLNKRLNNGDVISENDIMWRRVPKRRVRDTVIQHKDEVLGFTPRRTIIPDRPLRRSDLVTPELVSKGDLVSLYYYGSGIELKTEGVALSGGAKGEVIRVRNTRSNVVVQATVTEQNIAVVDYGSAARSDQLASR